MAKQTYKVKGGKHRIGKTVYTAGQTFESTDELSRMFPFKFKLVESPGVGDVVATQPDIPLPKTKITKIPEEGASPIPEEETPKIIDEKTPPIPDPATNVHGEDVSSEFPDAAKADLVVYKKGAWYVVVDADDGEVMTEKKLRKPQVKPFLVEYVD